MITLKTQYSDYPLILAWRNTPLVYEGFYSQKVPIDWETHLNWWLARNKDWKSWMIMFSEDVWVRPIGEVRATQMDNWNPEVNIFIGETPLWGKGVGLSALKLLLDTLKSMGYKNTHTTIRNDNERAIGLFEAWGFLRVCDAREGESRYEKKL